MTSHPIHSFIFTKTKVISENECSQLLGILSCIVRPSLTIGPPSPPTQRVCVTFTVLFSFLAANAVFFGRAKVSAEQDLSIAIYSALFVVPVGVIFPLLFMVRLNLVFA